jgi:hypothetical protein
MTQGKLNKKRRSSRLNRKHTGSHSRKPSTSNEAKLPKIVNSSSSTEKSKLEALHSPNKGSPRSLKVMKIVRTVTIKVKVNHHPTCTFGFQQTYLQELKSYLMQ